MHRSPVFSFILAAVVLSWPLAGHAAPRDSAATAKIDEAINQYYLATEFDRAEEVLVGTLEACEDRCSPQVKARAWMYVGIVRGSGKQDVSGAQQAFQQALALDPQVRLDAALATQAVKDAFAAAADALGQAVPSGPAPAPATSSAGVVISDDSVEGTMSCSPDLTEVETRRPIPLSCTTDEPATRVSIRYKVFGGEQWQTVQMTKRGKSWQGEIPCNDTGIAGALQFFVRAQDRGGDLVDSFGTKTNPVTINLVNQSSAPAPAYPGQSAPQRCMETGACPEDMIGTPACPGTGGEDTPQRGTKGWGASCDASQECEVGLLCMDSEAGKSCETAPSCDADADCPSDASCESGVCEAELDAPSPSGPFKRHWIGLHGGVDFPFIGGTDVCSKESQDASLFSCYYGDGQPYPGQTVQGNAGKIGAGALPGTIRVMASYEYAFTANLGLGGRVGFAFNGAPQDFFPLHLEVRGRYWFGKNALGKTGLRPFVNVGGGMAEVNAGLTVRVADCSNSPDIPNCRVSPPEGAEAVKVDAYKKLGRFFVSAGAGAMYAFHPSHGVVLNVNFLYLFPSPTTGAALQPTLGYAVGF